MEGIVKKERIGGVTLIALVITIIVLLILAGVSIAILTEENGIMNKATNSKEETRGANVQEARDLWRTNQEADKHSNSKTAQTLEELIEELVDQKLLTDDEKDSILGNKEKEIEATYQVTIGNRNIKFKEDNGNIEELKIGDYIDYKPDTITVPYDKVGETYTGYPNTGIMQDTTLKWRILDISENTINLISDKPVEFNLYFQGARGYNNAEQILNEYCKQMYSNKSYQAVGRSLNIEDVQNKMRTNQETRKERIRELYK